MSTMKSIKLWSKKFMKTVKTGKTPSVLGWVKLMQWNGNFTERDLQVQWNSIEITMTFLTGLGNILTFIWKHKKTQTDRAILNKNSNVWGITIPDFESYYRAIVTQIADIGEKQNDMYTSGIG
jgi:hypothetical protein